MQKIWPLTCLILLLGKASHSAVGRIALVMSVACASAGTVEVIVCTLVQAYKKDNDLHTKEVANVVLGALVAVTGCAPFIEPYYAVIIGGKLYNYT